MKDLKESILGSTNTGLIAQLPELICTWSEYEDKKRMNSCIPDLHFDKTSEGIVINGTVQKSFVFTFGCIRELIKRNIKIGKLKNKNKNGVIAITPNAASWSTKDTTLLTPEELSKFFTKDAEIGFLRFGDFSLNDNKNFKIPDYIDSLPKGKIFKFSWYYGDFDMASLKRLYTKFDNVCMGKGTALSILEGEIPNGKEISYDD